MAILTKGCKPDNFESQNSLRLSLTNNRGLHSNFVNCESFLKIKLSWHSCSIWDKPGWLNWFWQFLCEGLFSFNPKRFSTTQMYDLAIYVKKRLPFARDLSLENSADSHLCYRLTLLCLVTYFFFLISHHLCLYYALFVILILLHLT